MHRRASQADHAAQACELANCCAPLDVPENEITANTLYGGGYYLSTKPYRGIRISAVEPTAMGGGRSALAPVFRFVGDWSAFAAQAALLTMEGQQDLRIELL